MSRYARGDGERFAELAQEAALKVAGILRGVVPPEAQIHLLNAQRELISALIVIYEHQSRTRGEEPPRPRRPGARTRTASERSRLNRIDID